MRLFHRSNPDTADIPEDLQPYYDNQAGGIGRWLGPILRGVALLVVLALLVWGGIWGVHKLTSNQHAGKNTSAQSSQSGQHNGGKSSSGSSALNSPAANGGKTSPQPSPAPSPKPSQPSGSATPSPTPAPTPTPSAAAPSPAPAAPSPSATASPPVATNKALVNTGPGQVAALFGAVSMVGGFLYRLRLIRSLNR